MRRVPTTVNRTKSLEYCAAFSSVHLNSRFRHPPSHKLTYRDLQTPLGAPRTPDGYAELDHGFTQGAFLSRFKNVVARPDILSHSHHVPLEILMDARPKKIPLPPPKPKWNRARFKDEQACENFHTSLDAAWMAHPWPADGTLEGKCESIHAPLRTAPDSALVDESTTGVKQEWLSLEAVEYLDMRTAAEQQGDAEAYASAHTHFRALAKRDKQKDRVDKLGTGRWEQLSPLLRSFPPGSVSLRDEVGRLQPSIHRAELFAKMLRTRLWAPRPDVEFPDLLKDLIFRLPDGSEDRPWERYKHNQIMAKLPNRRSALPDGFGYEWLKQAHASPQVRERIFRIEQDCLEAVDVPPQYDVVHVIPGFKGRPGLDPSSDSSCRFFAMLPSLEKVLERHVAQRLGEYVYPRLRPTFFGFVPGLGSEDEIAWVRRLQERFHKSVLWALFLLALDLFKAFDSMIRSAVAWALRAWGVVGKLAKLILRLTYARVAVRGVGGAPNSSEFHLKEGGKTGGPMTPIIFIMVLALGLSGMDLLEHKFLPAYVLREEKALLKARDAAYADDLIFLALHGCSLEARTEALRRLGPPLGLIIEYMKCNAMVMAADIRANNGTALQGPVRRIPIPHIGHGDEKIQHVSSLRLLGGIFNRTIAATADIKVRTQALWAKYFYLKNILKGAKFSPRRTLRIHDSIEGAVLSHNLKTHTLTHADAQHLDGLQKKLYRAVLGWPPPWSHAGALHSIHKLRMELGFPPLVASGAQSPCPIPPENVTSS